MIRFRIAALLFSFTFFFALAAVATLTYLELKKTVGKDFVFEIPNGASLVTIAERLSEGDSLPCHKAIFRVVGLLTRGQGHILAGQYQVKADMTAPDLLHLFRSGEVIQYRLTFPEGWTVSEWRKALKEAPHLNSMSDDLNDIEVAQLLGVPESIEGWLFPDTYQYVKGDADLQLLNRAHERMKSILASEWQARAANNQVRSEKDALILASLIEKETGLATDRTKIASVFLNRLKLGMKLQSDPTVIYGLGEQFDGDLKRSHLRTDTAYNTYTRRGLPIGPICSPGRASIRAALAGSNHPYLYFVAMGDGRSYFSLTLSEHNLAVDQYQRKAQ